MEIVRFERQHIEDARALAFANYCEERTDAETETL